jgi:hypothetical protein
MIRRANRISASILFSTVTILRSMNIPKWRATLSNEARFSANLIFLVIVASCPACSLTSVRQQFARLIAAHSCIFQAAIGVSAKWQQFFLGGEAVSVRERRRRVTPFQVPGLPHANPDCHKTDLTAAHSKKPATVRVF